MKNKEIIEALRMCCSSSMTDCSQCPENGAKGGICFERLNKRAADTIEQMEAELAKLREENLRMRDTTEGYVAELARQMADMARECNTAQERGLPKASGDYVLVLNQIQEKLVALGRASVVAAEPVDGGWRVSGITVEGREVFGEVGGDSAENG